MIKHADLDMMMRRHPGPIAGHPPPPMNPHQLQAQQQAELQRRELLKRQSRKPTDKNLPDGVDDLIIGDGVAQYKSLREVERKIDAAMMRKRLDINDFMSRNLTSYKTMRIWISNTAENQPWQQGAMDTDAFDFNTESQATYRVTIAAKLLDDEHDADAKKDEEPKDADAMDEDSKTPPPRRRALRRSPLPSAPNCRTFLSKSPSTTTARPRCSQTAFRTLSGRSQKATPPRVPTATLICWSLSARPMRTST